MKNRQPNRLTVFAYSLYHGITNVPGVLRKSSVRYSSTFISFAQAVALTKYIIALASAPKRFLQFAVSIIAVALHISVELPKESCHIITVSGGLVVEDLWVIIILFL